MNEQGYGMWLVFADRPGSWALLYEYDISPAGQEAQRKCSMRTATARSEFVGGHDEWRLQVDFLHQNGEWKISQVLLARRPDGVAETTFRDWMNERIVPKIAFLLKAELKKLLASPTSEWEAIWLAARRRQAKGKKGDPEAA